MHRMQGLRSGMRGMERPTIWRNCFRQYLSDDAGDPLELLEPDPFNEHVREEDGSLMWLMRKNQCMHCAEPGCLAACPADGAIVQYTNGIVDFQQANCIGCGYCITGCPFDIPKMNPKTHRVFKCTLCADRVSEGLEPACIKSCPTGCLHFGSKEDMKFLAEGRAKQL